MVDAEPRGERPRIEPIPSEYGAASTSEFGHMTQEPSQITRTSEFGHMTQEPSPNQRMAESVGSGQHQGPANGNPLQLNDLERIIHAPEGELPSDTVSSPVMRSTGNASHMTHCIVMLAATMADTLACVRAVVNTVLVTFGKAPDRCRKACRLIVCQRTRATCGNPCCLPHDHGAVWNHTCTEHVQLGGHVSWKMVRINYPMDITSVHEST